MPTPNTDCDVDNELRSVASSAPNNVWAVGVATDGHGKYKPLTEHWDGSSWAIVPTPPVPGRDGQLNAVTVIDSRDAWAVGLYITGDGARTDPQTLTEHWDGRAWSVVPSPNQAGVESSLRAIVAANSHDVWAGGRIGTYLPQAPLLLHWDGVSWSAISGAPPPSQTHGHWVGADLLGLSAGGPRDVWAVGSFFDEGGGSVPHPLAEHWDGSSWSLTPVDPITFPARAHYFQAVTAFLRTDAWAVDPESDIRHWDGTRWTKVAGAAPHAVLNGIAGSGPADIWVVGEQSMIADWNALIEHWNGRAWTTVTLPPPAWPTANPSSPSPTAAT